MIRLSQYEIRASKVKLHSGHPRSLIFISGNVFQRASEVCKTRLLTESVWDLQVFDFKDYFRVTWVITMKLFVWGRNLVLWKPNQRVLVEISLSKRKNRDFGKKLSKKREKKLRNSRSLGNYQSEGEEEKDRAHKNQLFYLFYVVLTRQKP